MVKDYLAKMLKIKEFLREVALRRRFKKKQRALIKIQAFYRVVLAKKQLRKLRTAKNEEERKQQMQDFCTQHEDTQLLNNSALKIQSYINKKV